MKHESEQSLGHQAAPCGEVPTAAPLQAPRASERRELPGRPLGWIADQHRKQEERRCYVCGGRDDGGCHGIDGQRAECPWF